MPARGREVVPTLPLPLRLSAPHASLRTGSPRWRPYRGEFLTSALEQSRQMLSRSTKAGTKSELGQFLTPAPTARFMADMFSPAPDVECRLLDPGAGIGSLAVAVVERWASGDLRCEAWRSPPTRSTPDSMRSSGAR